MSKTMIKYWIRHPLRTFYWWRRMRGNIKLTVDLGESLPINTELKRQQKLALRKLLSQYKVSDLQPSDSKPPQSDSEAQS